MNPRVRRLNRQLLAAAALALTIVAGPATAATPASTPAPASPPPAAAPADPWLHEIGPAFTLAERTGRLVIVDLFADWCTWCHTMDQQVFSTPRFREFAGRFVLLRVDVEDQGEGTALRDRFNAPNLPTLLVLDARQARVGAIEGFLAVEALIARIEAEIATWNGLVTAFEAGEFRADRELFKRLVGEFHERGDGRRAALLYRELLAADPPESARRWTRYMLADALRLAGDPAEADRELGEARRAAVAADDRELLERVDLLRFYLEQDRGRCAEAKAALEGFLRDYPQSPQTLKVRSLLRHLRLDGRSHCT